MRGDFKHFWGRAFCRKKLHKMVAFPQSHQARIIQRRVKTPFGRKTPGPGQLHLHQNLQSLTVEGHPIGCLCLALALGLETPVP